MRMEFKGTERFQILYRLGSGGMGVVYAAYDREHRIQVALKTLWERNPSALLRLKNEFRVLQDLSHPNLVTLGELFEEKGQWFFTMEFVDGVDFITYVRGEGELPQYASTESGSSSGYNEGVSAPSGPPPMVLSRAEASSPQGVSSMGPVARVDAPDATAAEEPVLLDEDRLRDAIAQLVQGISVLHASNRVHRDIKPSNILVSRRGRVVLLDFGLVTQQDTDLASTEHNYPVGTAAFMAPEQAASHPVGPEADWYSVGVVLFQALTGRLPYTGTPLQILYAKQDAAPPRCRDLVAQVPEDLDALCWDLMQYSPASRPDGAKILSRLKVKEPRFKPEVTATFTRSLFFVGREQELSALFEAFGQLIEDKPVCMVVHGDSGLGKSELLRTFTRELHHRHPQAVVLSGRCYERESVPFKAFDGVIDALSRLLRRMDPEDVLRIAPRNMGLLMRVFPVLGRVRSLGIVPRATRGVEDLQELRSVAFRALRDLLAGLAELYPLVMIIDDLQWADADSLKLLRALLQTDEAPKICLLTSLRTTTQAEASQTDHLPGAEISMISLEEAASTFPKGLQLLQLEPLSAVEAHVLAARLLESDLLGSMDDQSVQSIADRIARESSGHPLFIHELAQYAQTLGQRSKVEALRLDDALFARIADLEQPLRTIVELVAVAGGPIKQETVAEVVGLQPASFSRQVAKLRVANLVHISGARREDSVEPYHDRVREAVLGRLSGEERQQWHRQLAQALEASKWAEPERLAYHFEGARDTDKAARYAVDAAARASATLAFDRAARLYQKALTLWPSPDSEEGIQERREILVRQGDALANAGRGGRAAEAYLEALDGAGTAESQELKRRAAEQLMRSGRINEGLELIEQVFSALGMKLPRTPLKSLLSLLRRRLQLRLRGIGFQERDESQLSAESLLRMDICHSVATGLAIADHIRGADFSTRFVLSALDAGEPHRLLIALTTEANFVAASGRARSRYMQRLIATSEELLKRHRDFIAQFYLDGSKAFASYMAGEWSAAREHAEYAESLLASHGGGWWELATARFVILWSLFWLGELEELTRRVVSLIQQAQERGDRFTVSGMAMGLPNLAVLNQKGSEQAREQIREVMQSWRVKEYHLQHYYALLAETHIDLYLGEGIQAHERLSKEWPLLKRSLLLKIPSVQYEALGLRGRAALNAACAADPSERKRLLALASKHAHRLTKHKLAWTSAMAKLIQAGVAAQRGEAVQARSLLETAITAMEEAKMGLMAAAARRRLGQLIGGDAGAEQEAEGNAFMSRQKVTDPQRMTALLAPGFPDG